METKKVTAKKTITNNNKQRRTRKELIETALEKIEARLGSDDMKPSVGDLIRLLQLQKEIQAEEPKEIKVTWIEPTMTESVLGQ